MGYIHALFTLLVAVLYLLIGLVLIPVQWVVKKISPLTGESFGRGYAKFGLKVISIAAGIRMNVIGRENLPKEGEVLYVANHRSIFDVVAGIPYIPGRFGIIAKDSLKKVPVLRYWMAQIHCIFLDRSDIKAGVQMVTDSVNFLKSGVSMFIFPEGTRGKTEGALLPMHGGSFKIAIKAGKPVVPITFIGTGDVFEDHFPRIKSKKITMIIDEPIPTEGMSIADRKLLPKRCEEIIQANLDKYKV